MTRKILVGLTSAVVVALALALAGTEGAWAAHDGHHRREQTTAAKGGRRAAPRKRVRAARHRARAGRRANHAAATYSCPMHPDVREKAAGTCPKCLMNLERETAKARQ